MYSRNQVQITGRKDNWKSCSVLKNNIKMALKKLISSARIKPSCLHANELSSFIKRG